LAAIGTFGAGVVAAGALAGGAAGLVTNVALGVVVAGVSLVIVSSGGGCDMPLYELGFCAVWPFRFRENAASPVTRAAVTLRFFILIHTPYGYRLSISHQLP
jgi:hypothetical protein